MGKVNPDELRQIGAEVEAIKIGHPDLLRQEPEIANHLNEAQAKAMEKYKEVVND